MTYKDRIDTTSEQRAEFETVFTPFAEMIEGKAKVLLLRDYHVENLIWMPERGGVARVGLLDFRDAHHDVSADVEARVNAHYLKQTGMPSGTFKLAYAILGVQRNLRILGLFVKLCLRDGKQQYIEMIPRVWSCFQRDLSHPELIKLAYILRTALPFPTLERPEKLRNRCATNPTP